MKSNDWRHKNVARYTPGNTKILYFFNCLLDGMHTKIKHICDFSRGGLNVRLKRSHPNLAPRPQICFIYLQEFCSLAAQKISWRDLGKRTGDVEVPGNEIL